jgi:hypothetical protein
VQATMLDMVRLEQGAAEGAIVDVVLTMTMALSGEKIIEFR